MVYKPKPDSPFGVVVPIERVALAPAVSTVRRRYEEIYGVEPDDRSGWFHEADWNRISFVLEATKPGEKILDVGLGAGQFVNSLALSGRFDEIHGADPTRFAKYVELTDGVQRVDNSIHRLPYEDGEFDVVTCMEVLEHLEDRIYEEGLSELRRVCGGQLLMTVPFEEPEPISRSHRRRYETPDLRALFPDADFVLMDRPHMPWALVEEWPSGRPADGSESPLRKVALEGAVAALQWETRWLRSELAKPMWRQMYTRSRRLAGRAKRAFG